MDGKVSPPALHLFILLDCVRRAAAVTDAILPAHTSPLTCFPASRVLVPLSGSQDFLVSINRTCASDHPIDASTVRDVIPADFLFTSIRIQHNSRRPSLRESGHFAPRSIIRLSRFFFGEGSVRPEKTPKPLLTSLSQKQSLHSVAATAPDTLFLFRPSSARTCVPSSVAGFVSSGQLLLSPSAGAAAVTALFIARSECPSFS